jgi:hypothetical protein
VHRPALITVETRRAIAAGIPRAEAAAPKHHACRADSARTPRKDAIMDGKSLAAHFGRIGARVRLRERSVGDSLRLDIARDKQGRFFDILAHPGTQARVIDVEPGLRHLLLLGHEPAPLHGKRRFLCGHDEREWFVAAVPGRDITRVRQAMEALKPRLVRFEQDRKGVRVRDRLRRRTAAYTRQGEWFFVPAPGLAPRPQLLLRNEPLSRGRGKPHWAEQLYREGGQPVMVCTHRPSGITVTAYQKLLRDRPAAALWDWRPMRLNARVFVRGTVRHPDHATIRLDGWHRVVMNTEGDAPGRSSVVFLD